MDKKTGKLKTVIYIVLAVSASTFFVTLPILCAISGAGILDKQTVLGLIFAIIFGIVSGFRFGLLSGIVSGLISGIGSEIGYGFSGLAGIVTGLISGLIFGIVFGMDYGMRIVYGFIFGSSFGLISGLKSGLVFGLIFGIVFCIGYFVSFISIRKILPLFTTLPKVIRQTMNGLIHPRQLKEYSIGMAIASFIIFYISTVLIFSLWYYTLFLEDYSFFKILDEIAYPVWWHFFYFSLVTIATVGYGDISPVGIIPQVLVVVEILFGFGLIAFYLATIFQIIARIEPKDESLQLQERDRQISELISEIAKCNKQQDEIIKLTKQSERNRRRLRTTVMRKDRRQRL